MRVALVYVCLLAAVGPAFGQSSSLADLIRAGNRKAALERVRAGADVNTAQPDGTRPIHWAVYKVDYELIAALIAKKAAVDVANEFGSTPLAEAVKLTDARVVKMLLAAGAGVDRADEQELRAQKALVLPGGHDRSHDAAEADHIEIDPRRVAPPQPVEEEPLELSCEPEAPEPPPVVHKFPTRPVFEPLAMASGADSFGAIRQRLHALRGEAHR